jgi:S-adenosylmethionine:tRNA ribosyltransferase-isomerase
MNRAADEDDVHRYQTVFADPNQAQAVAAPTAGLHFDDNMLAQIQSKGVKIAYVTLHVGPGTFLPMRTDVIEEHQMHAEPYIISEQAAQIINSAKRVIAVGTTSLRALESSVDDAGLVRPGSGLTRLFITPGFQFRVASLLLTNFHLPKTTLMLLVAAAVGKDRLLNAYREAIANQYRFFSYGDACLFEIADV